VEVGGGGGRGAEGVTCEIGVTCNESMPILGLNTLSLQKPVSMTYLMPSIVSDVSATLVDTMIFRASDFSKIFTCCSAASCVYSGKMTMGGTPSWPTA
jgi:hypothetical protein